MNSLRTKVTFHFIKNIQIIEYERKSEKRKK